MSQKTTPEQSTKLVTIKNNIMIGTSSQLHSIKDLRMSDLPEGQLEFFVNTQWLTPDNRIKFNIMSEGHNVTTNNVDPKLVDNREEYFVLAQQPRTTTRGKTMSMSQEHIDTLNELLTTYNKSTLTKQLIKLTIKM